MTAPSSARVALVNLGCRLNRVESDIVANALISAGCELVDKSEADAIVINTCAVTGEAQTKTRKAVRGAARLSQSPFVVATGCAASLFASELRELGPNVVVEARKDLVAKRVLQLLGTESGREVRTGILALSPTPTGRTRPGIKIQDGCDNRCTYCIVWKARGPSRSVSSGEVVRAVEEAYGRGAHEVVLTGVNLGNYRTSEKDELGINVGLDGLLSHILRTTSIDRVRISSLEPPDVSCGLLDVMASSGGRVAPFLHICLQSGCDATLRRMGRVYDTSLYARVVKQARARMPYLALGCDLIVGFPGETEEEFEQSYSFCEQMEFARMHVFRYSRRPGTPAAQYRDQVPPETMARRSEAMRTLAKRMRLRCMEGLLGTSEDVLVQSAGRAVSEGLFDVLVDESLPVGEFAHVRFETIEEGALVGKTTKS